MIEERALRIAQPGRGDPAFELVEIIDLGTRLGLELDLSWTQNYLWSLVGSPQAGAIDRDTLVRLAQKLWFDPSTLDSRVRKEGEPSAQATA